MILMSFIFLLSLLVVPLHGSELELFLTQRNEKHAKLFEILAQVIAFLFNVYFGLLYLFLIFQYPTPFRNLILY